MHDHRILDQKGNLQKVLLGFYGNLNINSVLGNNKLSMANNGTLVLYEDALVLGRCIKV